MATQKMLKFRDPERSTRKAGCSFARRGFRQESTEFAAQKAAEQATSAAVRRALLPGALPLAQQLPICLTARALQEAYTSTRPPTPSGNRGRIYLGPALRRHCVIEQSGQHRHYRCGGEIHHRYGLGEGWSSRSAASNGQIGRHHRHRPRPAAADVLRRAGVQVSLTSRPGGRPAGPTASGFKLERTWCCVGTSNCATAACSYYWIATSAPT